MQADPTNTFIQPPASLIQSQPKAITPHKPATPQFIPASNGLSLSSVPTDQEIATLRVFEEPLAPLTASSSDEDNEVLASAIKAFAQNYNDPKPLTDFLDAHPHSRWEAALLTDLGIIYKQHGVWTKALSTWEAAWSELKDATSAPLKNLADRTLGELTQLHSRLGHFDRLQELLSEADQRNVGGSGTARVAGARQGLWLMKNKPGLAFRCGPLAISRIYQTLHPGVAVPDSIRAFQSTQEGTCLANLNTLAEQVGLEYQIAFRNPGAAVLYPSLVHWKAGHYAAISKKIDDSYLVQDPTFGQDTLVTAYTLDAEASGYFLVPKGPLPAGWRVASSDEAKAIFGKGSADDAGPDVPDDYDPEDGGDDDDVDPSPKPPCQGMAGYTFGIADISLVLNDTPVGYSPPRGPSAFFTLSYNHREIAARTNISNLGPKWTFEWSSYIMAPSVVATVSYGPGNGQLAYSGFSSGTNQFAQQQLSGNVLVFISANSYEMRHPDGSKDIYSLAETGANPRIFRTSQVDARGNALTFAYDDHYRMRTVTDAIGQVTVIDYTLTTDPSNSDYYKVTKVTDPFGRYASFTYNAAGELNTITDVLGIVSQFSYGAGDFISALTTPYGTTHFRSNDQSYDRWLEATDPTGARERVEWVQHSTDIADSDPANTVPSGFYNAWLSYRNTFFWSKKAMADAPGDYTRAKITHWLHLTQSDDTLSSFTPESVKEPFENRVWYSYAGQPQTNYAGTISQPSSIARVLDDGTQQVYKFVYNTAGNPLQTIDPLGRETDITYAANGIDVLLVKQKNGATYEIVSQETYNTQHLPLTQTDAAGQTTHYGYDSFGDLQTITNAKNETTTYTYQTNSALPGFGRMQTITGPMTGSTTTFAYDGFGRVQTVTDSDNYSVTTQYDAFDRPTKITYPDSTYAQFLYNRLDPEWTRDRLGRWSQDLYNDLRQVVMHVDPMNRQTVYDRCSCGALQGITDPAGNHTTWVRDLQGRPLQKIYPDGKIDFYTYEQSTSRLKRVTDARNQAVNYTYYSDNNIAAVTYTDGAGQPLTPATPGVTYNYDTIYDRITAMTDGIGTTTYTYNPITSTPTLGAGKLYTVSGPLANSTISYVYDELGRVTTQSINGTANQNVATYDGMDRIGTVTNLLGQFTYNYVGTTSRLSSLVYPNGQQAAYTYFDNLGDKRLKQIKNLGTGATPPILSQFDYTYDAVGQILTWTQNYNGAANPQRYEPRYDLASQLVGAALKNGTTNALIQDYAYAYDLAGNRTQEQIAANVTTSNYNNLNQLTSQAPAGAMEFHGTINEPGSVSLASKSVAVDSTGSWRGHANVTTGSNAIPITATDASGNATSKTIHVTVTGNPARTLIYDANGNLTDDGAGRTYAYDAANRLVKITKSGNVSEFVYDGNGRRTQEKLNTAVIKQWVWTGGSQPAEERDASNSVTKRYFAQGEQIGGSSYYFTSDHLGSTRELIDSTGAVRARYAYDPYGRSTKLSGDLESDFDFTGFYRHQASGLNLTMYRAYDPDLGRWLSRDPKGEDGGLNLYGYVANNPISGTDSYGLIIDVSSGDQANYNAAINYLNKSPTAKQAIDALQNSSTHYTLVTNSSSDDYYDPALNQIHWDPTSAFKVSGGTQSPALGLLHEIGHGDDFDQSPIMSTIRSWIGSWSYDDQEEAHVIQGLETTVANELGEGTRKNHKGDPYRTNSPASRDPKPCP